MFRSHSRSTQRICVILLGLSPAVVLAQQTQTDVAAEPAPYPRINLAPSYEVDATWPSKPEQYEWQAVPGVAVDNRDNVWVFTRSSPPIQVYTPSGELVRAWGDGKIKTAHHIEIDRDGNVWVADIGLHVVRKFSPQGEIMLTIGTPGEAGNDQERLNQPTDMAIAPNGDVFVSDGYGNNRVVHFDGQGKFVKSWGKLGTGSNEFSLPHAIAIDSGGRLYVADRNNVRVMIYGQDGQLLDQWNKVMVPWGFWITAEDHIWVCGSTAMPWQRHRDYPDAPLGCPPKDQVLMKFNTAGRLLEMWTIPKGMDGQEKPGDVNWIHAMAVDSEGNIYTGDIIGRRAQKFVRKD